MDEYLQTDGSEFEQPTIKGSKTSIHDPIRYIRDGNSNEIS